ncbi:MAG: hypothetical protein JKY66_04785, partial [Spongiibacteraceae bacterium]|nr:hypothetical protein [Spongiibacteraceae bacterium]
VDDVNNSINVGLHLFKSGQGVLYSDAGGGAITGLESGTIYYAVVLDSSTIQLALSEEDALAASPVIVDISALGISGTHKISEIEAIRDGSVWSDSQLRFSVGGGWLKKVADTTTRIEAANVSGANIVLDAVAIGSNTEEVVIDLSSGLQELTDTQKVVLAAAERENITIIDGPDDSITVGRPHDLTTGDGFDLGAMFKLYNIDGLNEGQTYYAIVIDAFTFQLASTEANALAGTVDVDIISHETRVGSKEDIDISASGTITATSDTYIYLGSEQAFNIDTINAGGAVQIKVGDVITDASSAELANITATELLLEAAGGSIGSSGDLLDITLTSNGRLTARAEESIHIKSLGTDLYVDTLFSKDSIVLRSDGSILDAYDNDNENIDTVSLSLYSAAGIGVDGNALELNQRPDGLLYADAVGSIYLSEVAGDMNIDRITSTTGDVTLTADVSILDYNNDLNANIIANNIKLLSSIGSVGADLNDLDIDTAFSGTGTLEINSNNSAHITETAGDLSIYQIASTLGTVFVANPVGQILNGNVSGANVISGSTLLFAASNIGTELNPLGTIVGFLEGYSTSGDVWISNTGNLTLGGVTGSTKIISGGDLNVVASSPVTVTVSQDAASISILATDDDETVSGNEAPDHLIVKSGVTLNATSGSVLLQAGDDLIIEAGASILATGTVTLEGDFGDADTGVGSLIDIQGTVSGSSILIRGNDDDDIIVITGVTADTDVQTFAGNDIIRVGSLATATTNSGGELSSNTANLTIDGGDHSVGDSLLLDDSANTTGNNFTLTDSGITGLFGSGTLSYTRIENLDLVLGSGDDVVNIQSTSAGSQITINGSGGNDTFNISSDAPVNAGTLNDIAGDVIIEGGDDGDTLNLSDSGDSMDNSMTLTATSLSGLGMTGVITYADIEQLDVELGTGNDTIDIQTTATDVQTSISGNDGNDQFTVLTTGTDSQISISGNAGDDTFNLQTTATGSQTTVNGDTGADTFNLSSDAPTNSGGLSGFLGDVDVLGGDDKDRLNLSDAANTTDINLTVSDTGVTGLNIGLISYEDIQQLDVTLGSGNDTITVESTSADVETTIRGSLGDDTFNIQSTATGSLTTLIGDAGVDTFNISSDAPANVGTVNDIAGDVIIEGGDDTDSLNLSDAGDSTNNTLTVTDTRLTGLGMSGVITYADMDLLDVILGSGNDTIIIQSTATDIQTSISGNAGADTFNLQTTATGSLTTLSGDAGADIFNISSDAPNNAGTVNGIVGGVIIEGGNATDSLNLSDAGDTTDNTLTVTVTGLSGLGMAVGISYAGIDELDVALGSGNDTVAIETLAANAQTTISGNAGDDQVTVAATVNDGELTVFAGAGNDYIDAVAAGISVTLNGGLGDDVILGGAFSDRLTGGAGNDYIIGDYGQTSYQPFEKKLENLFEMSTSTSSVGGNDLISGGSGNDILIGAGGDDSLSGGTGLDILIGDGGQINFGPGDIISARTTHLLQGGNDSLDGGAGNDILFGGTGNNVFKGNFSEDLVLDFASVTLVNDSISRLDNSEAVQGGLLASNTTTLFAGTTTSPGSNLSFFSPAPGLGPEGIIIADISRPFLSGLFPNLARSAITDEFNTVQSSFSSSFPLRINISDELTTEQLLQQQADTDDAEESEALQQEGVDEMLLQEEQQSEVENTDQTNSSDELELQPEIDAEVETEAESEVESEAESETEAEDEARSTAIELGSLVAALSGWQVKADTEKKKRYNIRLTGKQRAQTARVLHWDEDQVKLIDKQAVNHAKPWYTA